MMRPIRIFVYGDVDTNLIDGSSIWLQSLVELLHLGERNHITLLLKKTEQRQVVTGQLHRLERVRIVDPLGLRSPKDRLSPSDVPRALRELDQVEQFDIVLVRGNEVARTLSREPNFEGRLWVYYLPPSSGSLTPSDLADLDRFSSACRYVLCQTEQIRALLESAAPDLSRTLVLLPPMIPDVEPIGSHPAPSQDSADGGSGRVTRLVYVGKFSAGYRFLEMVEMFRELRHEIPDVELHIAGDKIHNPGSDPVFESRVKDALRNTPGLIWHGSGSRAEVQEILAEADIALSIRDPSMDDSRELSTKVLEYGASGLPVVLNRSPMYEDLLGRDYPLFVDHPLEGLNVVRRALAKRELVEQAASACHQASLPFRFHQIYEDVRPLIEREAPEQKLLEIRGRPPRILVAGHDMRFFRPISRHLELAGAVVVEDQWSGHDSHDETKSKELIEWADAIICEWCLGNAVWYSHHKEVDQPLLMRLHRVEIESEYPSRVNISNVDHVIFVSPHILRRAVEELAWPSEKLSVIANPVDLELLNRRKVPGSDFNLGMLGYVDSRKRPDRAVEILELLRTQDDRFRLYLKGPTPWDLAWVWRKETERSYYARLKRRIESTPGLTDTVSFEPFGQDIASWFQKIGFVLSTSDSEGNQVAVAEGMASGAIPIVLDRPGASDLYPPEFVFDSAATAAEGILNAALDGSLEVGRRIAQEFAKTSFSRDWIMGAWENLLGKLMRTSQRRTANAQVDSD